MGAIMRWTCLLLLIGSFVVHGAFNVTMASVSFAGGYGYSVDANEKASLSKLAGIVDGAKESSDLVAVPEGYFWWYLATRDIALSAASIYVQVVDGYTTDIDGEKRRLNPCDDNTKVENVTDTLRSLSCLAKEKSIYVAANIATKSESESGGPEATKLWNTEVVLDSHGNLVATYRKSHSYGGSPPFDTPAADDLDVSWFSVSTDDVTTLKIGLLICFDLEFARPARSLVQEVGVDAILMSQYWVNTPPVSWSTLYQQAWSLMYPGVTMIAVNDGNNAQTWGAGAYHSGLLVSDREAFATSDEGEGSYNHLLSVSLPVHSPDGGGKAPSALVISTSPVEKKEQQDEISSFPCHLAAYGTGKCVRIDKSGEARVSHGEAFCQGRRQGGENGDDDGVLLLAMDAQIPTEYGGEPLHLLLCSVFSCAHSNVTGTPSPNSEVQCDALYGTFQAASATVRMEAPSLARYQLLPMAADGSFHTLAPEHLHVRRDQKSSSIALEIQQAPLSTLSVASVFAVDQA